MTEIAPLWKSLDFEMRFFWEKYPMGKSGYMRKSSILKMRFFWGVFGI
jgi:hypothetical protein